MAEGFFGEFDVPVTVCVEHRCFVPCRSCSDSTSWSSDPADVEAVRRYQWNLDNEGTDASPSGTFLTCCGREVHDGHATDCPKKFVGYLETVVDPYQTSKCNPKPDVVNHPVHYTSHPSGIECIQITEHMGFNLGNAVKYVWRADLKNNALEDLKKALWYIEREISRRQRMEARDESTDA